MESLTKDFNRKRQTYKFWKKLYELLERNPTKIEMLRTIFGIIDTRNGFGSITNAEYSWESLRQLIQDKGLELNKSYGFETLIKDFYIDGTEYFRNEQSKSLEDKRMPLELYHKFVIPDMEEGNLYHFSTLHSKDGERCYLAYYFNGWLTPKEEFKKKVA